MSELTPQRRAPVAVEGPLISSGMGRGPHTWLAIALAIAGVVLGLIAQSSAAPAFIFAACGIGLVGEVPSLLRTGEVRARKYRSAPVPFLIIRKEDSPTHFYFHVLAYLLLGTFSFIAAGLFFAQVISKYVE